jgi:biopolymer transport protein ExbB
MLDWFERGGLMMYPLALASFVALTIIIERLITLRRKKILIPEIVNIVYHFKSAHDVDLARNICAKYRGPLPTLIKVGLENSELDREEIKELIEDQGRQEVRHLEKGLTILETIAVISPLLGLLGTVLGMRRVFEVIQEQGIGQAGALSGGISEALITTVTGLFIAIPALIFFNYYTKKAENFVLDIENHSNNLIQKLHLFKEENKREIVSTE